MEGKPDGRRTGPEPEHLNRFGHSGLLRGTETMEYLGGIDPSENERGRQPRQPLEWRCTFVGKAS
jgi:hypothetical protein